MLLTSLWALWNLLFIHSVFHVESVITERTFNPKAFIPIFKLVFSDLFSIRDLAFRQSTLELFSWTGRSRAYRQDIAFEYLDCMHWPPEAVIWIDHSFHKSTVVLGVLTSKCIHDILYVSLYIGHFSTKWNQSYTNSKNLLELFKSKIYLNILKLEFWTMQNVTFLGTCGK